MESKEKIFVIICCGILGAIISFFIPPVDLLSILFTTFIGCLIGYIIPGLFKKPVSNLSIIPGGKTYASKASEDDFIKYMHKCAREFKFQKNSEQEILRFFKQNYCSMKFEYVRTTGKLLVLNNIPGIINRAARTYKI